MGVTCLTVRKKTGMETQKCAVTKRVTFAYADSCKRRNIGAKRLATVVTTNKLALKHVCHKNGACKKNGKKKSATLLRDSQDEGDMGRRAAGKKWKERKAKNRKKWKERKAKNRKKWKERKAKNGKKWKKRNAKKGKKERKATKGKKKH